jgi:hypothetical protein
MVTILPTLRKISKNLAKILTRPAVEAICRELDHGWRERKLDPYTTLHLFILQILHRNTAMGHLPHLGGKQFSASAYCQARQRLPVELFEKLFESFASVFTQSDDSKCWRGHRVLLVDGSNCSMPDTAALRGHFGQPGAQRLGCGFPMAHLLALVDARSGFLQEMIVSPMRTHDMSLVAKLAPRIDAGDVLVGDRGFCSYAHLALLLQQTTHALFRMHQKQIVSFHPGRPCAKDILCKGLPNSRWIRRLGHRDQIVAWQKPQQRPKWMSAERFALLPEEIVVREIKHRIRPAVGRVHEVTLVTTLLDAERYPAAEIAKLYGQRWQVEVDLRDLKETLGMGILKGKGVDTVMKEMMVFALVYNLVRVVTVDAAKRQQTSPRRISFIDAMRWLQPPKPARSLPTLVVNPHRPDRAEPRCVKRRAKPHRLMMEPREKLQKRLRKRGNAA